LQKKIWSYFLSLIKNQFMKKNSISAVSCKFSAGFLLVASLAFTTGCKKDINPKEVKDFKQVNLVANNNEYNNPGVDSVLLNAWGLAFSSTGTAWVSSQAGHVSTIYDKDGNIVRPPVSIPSPGGPVGGNPTGVVFNGSGDFVLSNGQPARFIFVGVDGILSGWNGAAGNNALLIKNNVATSAYTGLALAVNAGSNFLYAANFRTGKIDVWDKNFNAVSMPFHDPTLPAGYSPFNIQLLGNWLYVAYAKVGPNGKDQAGPGNGYVSIFKSNGEFVKRFASKGYLNAPWGITTATPGFFTDNDGYDNKESINSKTGNQDNNDPILLVGNFGDGRISAYTADGQFIGQLKGHGHTIVIPGLWALTFPPASATSIDPNRLYFTAGPDDEEDGLFGYLIKE
jgi:uncharacterized protein (TIGR03118 family)